MKDNRKSWLKAASLGTSIASTLAGLVLCGFFLGKYIDALWGTRPWWTFVLMLVGLVLGGAYLAMTLIKLSADDYEK
ncbi:MAG: AtpZ/AtpI family protein [Desulfitobacteriaceae bacterium]